MSNDTIFQIAATIGFIMLAFALYRLWRGVRTLGWRRTEGVVQSSQVRHSRDSDGDDSYEVLVTYAYRVGGQDFASSRVAVGGLVRGNEARARMDLARYPDGTQVQVWHHPRRPERAVLERQALGWTVPVLGIGGLAIIIGFAAAFPGSH